MGLLSLAIWTPIVFGTVLLAMGRDEHARAVRWIALVGAIASFLVTLPLFERFDRASAGMQFVETAPWIERFNITYHLGLDGISFWFVLLTAFITIVVVISAWEVITERVNQYMGAFLILSGLMVGVFCALDGLLFYVFFEATLIPMYIIIGTLTEKAAKKAKNSSVCAFIGSGSLCQVAMSKLPPDLVYRYTSAISISSEPSSVYRKNLNAA